jgi:DMSO/TMAO reductase YedYZ molybdopterin-dependent catalytic subunit
VRRENLSSPIPPLAGAVVAIAAEFLLRTAAGTKLLAEVVVDASTYGLQPRGFSFLLSQLGPAGKPLLFVSVLIGEAVLYLIAWRLASRLSFARDNPVALVAAAGGSAGLVRIAVTAILIALTVAGLGSDTTWLEYGLVTFLTAGLGAAVAAALALPSPDLPDGVPRAAAGPSRRELLLKLPVLAAGAAALVLVARQVIRTTGGGAQTSHAGKETPEVTANKDYYIVSKNLIDPQVDEKKWRLRVGGSLAKMVEFTYDDLLALPAVDQYTTMQCISNEVNGDLMSNALWRGIRLKDLIAMAQPGAGVQYIAFRSDDDYTESLPLNVATQDGFLLAHTMNGERLPAKHGFPLRLLSPGKYGMKHPKWITEVAFLEQEYFGYWEQRGWSQENRMNTSCRIDLPAANSVIGESPYRISGVAFAGNRGISRVEVSVDGGSTWNEAVIKQALSPYTWVLWHWDWPVAANGHSRILARATDGSGEVQTSMKAPPYPTGATGYPFVPATVRLAM